MLSFCNLLGFVTSLTTGKAGKREKVGYWLLILGFFRVFSAPAGHCKTSRHVRAHLPQRVLWQSCWVFGQRGQGHRCFWLSCAAGTAFSRPSWADAKPKCRGEALEVSSWGNTRWSLTLTKHPVWALPEVLLKIRWRPKYNMNIIAAIFSMWWFRNWTGNKDQTPRLHLSVSHLHVMGAQELPQELRDFCISASTPPFGYFRFTVKINSLGVLGGALCLAQRRAQTQHTEGHRYGLVYPGFCLGSPTCTRSCREKRLVRPWHCGSSPFPFPLLAPFPLGTALPMPVVSRVQSLVYIFFPL